MIPASRHPSTTRHPSASRHPSAFRRRRGADRVATAALAAGGLLLAGALPASAHVHVEADEPTAGSFTVLTFRVPNESASAGTVKVEASLPTETPFLSVSTRPVPGWSATTTHQKLAKPVDVEGTTITEAITTVTWTAAKGTQIGPAQFQDFAISVGPLPDPTTILLPTSQTYSDGTVVRWDQETPPSGEEPEHPAPEFTIAAATGEGHDAGGSEPSAVSREPAAQETAETTATASTDTTARVLAGIALMLGAAALVVALVGRRRGAA